MNSPEKPGEIRRLIELVSRLRAPDGCPWDREQTMPDIRAYLLEEAHEVADAIDRGDLGDLCGELGDLLFQIVFLASLGQEAQAFDMADVIEGIHSKMIARHPHVFGKPAIGEPAFGNQALSDAESVKKAWEVRKIQEEGQDRSILDGVARSVPALLAAYRMTQKASGVGFDWPDVAGVLGKVHEELREVEEAIQEGSPEAEAKEAIREEVGDLLFALVNLARKVGVDPEAALAGTNLKFRHRFGYIETRLRDQGRTVADADLEEMDALWDEIKEAGRRKP